MPFCQQLNDCFLSRKEFNFDVSFACTWHSNFFSCFTRVFKHERYPDFSRLLLASSKSEARFSGF